MSEKLGDWKLRWTIGTVLLGLVGTLGWYIFQDTRAIAVQAQEKATELDTKVEVIQSVQKTTEGLASEVAEIKTKTAVVETNNKDIIRRLDVLDNSIDRLEAKVDYLISKTK